MATRDHLDEFPHLIKFELCSYPPALFESSCFPIQTNKSVLEDGLWKVTSNVFPELTDIVHYILDGGALLHHIPWPHSAMYGGICQLHIDYLTKKYGQLTVIFMAIKMACQLRIVPIPSNQGHTKVKLCILPEIWF